MRLSLSHFIESDLNDIHARRSRLQGRGSFFQRQCLRAQVAIRFKIARFVFIKRQMACFLFDTALSLFS
jgi:hypothetical protein